MADDSFEQTMAEPVSVEEMEACVSALESAFQLLESVEAARQEGDESASAAALQVEELLLTRIEEMRCVAASTFSFQDENLRPRFMKAFHDCDRIARIRAVLDATDAWYRDQNVLVPPDRVTECLVACQHMEKVLVSVGLETSLKEAQQRAKAALEGQDDSSSPKGYDLYVMSESDGEDHTEEEEDWNSVEQKRPTSWLHSNSQLPHSPVPPPPPPPPPPAIPKAIVPQAEVKPKDTKSSPSTSAACDAQIKNTAPTYGWVSLQGEADTPFKPRWLVMSKKTLFMYKDGECVVSRGQIDFAPNTEVVLVDTEPRSASFILSNVHYTRNFKPWWPVKPAPRQRFHINVGNPEALQMWISLLYQALSTLNCLFWPNPDEPNKGVIPLQRVGSSTLAGWLGKRGPTIGYSWQPRWCVLEGSTITYYEDDLQTLLRGQIQLGPEGSALPFQTACCADIPRHRASKPFGFLLDSDPAAGSNRRVYYFDAGNAVTLQTWVSAIARAASNADIPGITCARGDAEESW